MRKLSVVIALGALLAAAPAAGQSDPPAATVTAADGTPSVIAESTLRHWVTIAHKSTRGLKEREAQDQALELLIQNAWVAGEAAERGIAVSDARVAASFEDQKDQSFPTEAEYQRFLRESGFTDADVRFRVRLELLSGLVRESVTAPAEASVTDADVARWVRTHGPKRRPARRDIRLVLTRTRSAAQQALGELRAGASWKAVARRRSIDGSTKRKGGLLKGIVRGQQERSLDRAIFRAPKGALRGPVKTRFGFYVFTVVSVHASRPIPIAERRRTARGVLVSDAQLAAFDAFFKQYQAKWKARTACAAAFRWHEHCGR